MTDDLVAALEVGNLGGAALDVTDPEPLPDGHPLWHLPNCIITPHVGNTPEMAVPLLTARITENVSLALGFLINIDTQPPAANLRPFDYALTAGAEAAF